MKRLIICWLAVCALSACTVQPQPIEYGLDACSYCKMTIIDSQHAAELVSDKGKVAKFDAIECMLHRLQESEGKSYAFMLVSDYLQPGQLIDARTSTFLVSRAIPSPMGGYLTAFASSGPAIEISFDRGGEVYSWEEIQQIWTNNESLTQQLEGSDE